MTKPAPKTGGAHRSRHSKSMDNIHSDTFIFFLFKWLIQLTTQHIHRSSIPRSGTHTDCISNSATPDEDVILDVHPQHSNMIIGAGFSGKHNVVS